MKVTIIDPKQKEATLTMGDLEFGTLFTAKTTIGKKFTGLIIKEGFDGVNVVWLDSTPHPRTRSVKDSTLKDAPVTIIKTIELSTENP